MSYTKNLRSYLIVTAPQSKSVARSTKVSHRTAYRNGSSWFDSYLGKLSLLLFYGFSHASQLYNSSSCEEFHSTKEALKSPPCIPATAPVQINSSSVWLTNSKIISSLLRLTYNANSAPNILLQRPLKFTTSSNLEHVSFQLLQIILHSTTTSAESNKELSLQMLWNSCYASLHFQRKQVHIQIHTI